MLIGYMRVPKADDRKAPTCNATHLAAGVHE